MGSQASREEKSLGGKVLGRQKTCPPCVTQPTREVGMSQNKRELWIFPPPYMN